MDLRSELEARKKGLKPTKTILTNELGERFELFDGISRKLTEKCSPFIVDDKPDMQIARIVDGIFLSSQDPVTSEELLKIHGIGHVLSLGVRPQIQFHGISYNFVEFLDLPEFELSKALQESLGIIHRSRTQNVLVHCNAGVSRSATVVLAFLMAHQGLTYDEAFAIVKNARNSVRPNDGFVRQLKTLSHAGLKEILHNSVTKAFNKS